MLPNEGFRYNAEILEENTRKYQVVEVSSLRRSSNTMNSHREDLNRRGCVLHISTQLAADESFLWVESPRVQGRLQMLPSKRPSLSLCRIRENFDIDGVTA